MAETFNWTEDGHTVGVHYNHQLSRKLLEIALPRCIVNQFVHDHGIGFKKNAGETVNIMHMTELPDASVAGMTEDDEFRIDKPAFGNRPLTLKEYGSGVQWTNLMDILSIWGPMENQFQKKLRQQMENALDTLAANAFKDPNAVQIVFTPTSRTGGVYGVSGSPIAQASSAFTVDHCKKISAYMRDTIHVPYYSDETYCGLSSNTNIEALLDDPKAEKWQQYGSKMEFMYRGEMCLTYKIRWTETNRQGAFANTVGTCPVLGESVVFGDEAVARIEALAPHLRLSSNFQGRFATKQAAIWYAVMAYGSVWASASDGKAKIMRIGSL
jgi:N4-gp56 family major capsid protein